MATVPETNEFESVQAFAPPMPGEAARANDNDPEDTLLCLEDRRHGPAAGIILGVAISIVLWAGCAIAFAV